MNQVIAVSRGPLRIGGIAEEDICSSARAKDSVFLLVWLLLVVTRPSLWAAETSSVVQLSSDTQVATEGYFVLSWTATSAVDLLSLQQDASQNPQTPTIYAEQLPATGAITITGLRDGEYTYQLLGEGQTLSNNVTVTVQHHALSRALGFFLVGLILFAILVGTILLGRARTLDSTEEPEHPHRGTHA